MKRIILEGYNLSGSEVEHLRKAFGTMFATDFQTELSLDKIIFKEN